MMDRRTFLQSSVASVLASLIDREGGEQPTECDACTEISEKEREWLYTALTEHKKTTFETLMRPEKHAWTEDCEYRKLADAENVPYRREDFEAMDYSIGSGFHCGTLSVAVTFQPTEIPDYIGVTITVGDSQ